GAAAFGERGQRLALLRRRRARPPTARLVELCLHALQLAGQLAPARVQLEQTFEPRLVAAARQRRAHAVGVAADQLEVEDARPPEETSGPPLEARRRRR